MLAASLGFATMATCVAWAHRVAPTLDTAMTSFVRSIVNLVALVLFAWREPGALWGDRRASLWLRGAFGAVSLLAYFASIPLVGTGEAAFLNSTSLFWVAVLAPYVVHEKTRPATWIAIAGALVGTALLAHPRADLDVSWGRALGVGSGLSSALAYLTVRRASRTNSPAAVVFYFTLVSTVISGIWVLVEQAALPPIGALGVLAGAGLAATVAQLLMTEAYRTGAAAPIAAAGASGPAVTALFGWFFLDQVPDALSAAGMGVLFVSAVLLPFLSR